MKSLVKRILPSTWIAVLANTFNKLNRTILVPLFFREYPSSKINYLHKSSLPPAKLILKRPDPYGRLPTKIKDAFVRFNEVSQQEFVASVDNCFIEPKYGWPMTRSRELVYDCFPHSRQNIIPTPSLFRSTEKNIRSFDEIISFREIFEFGYWHFHTDILHKNYLLRNFPDINVNVPIVVSKALSTTPYFKFFYEKTDIFRHREVIVQDDFMISANRAYFAKPLPHTPVYYKTSSDMVRAWKGDASLRRRIFLSRAEHRGRFISNLKNLEPILKKYDIEFVDADRLTMEEQVKLFSETNLLVGIHGAGLTNMMFRAPETMSVLEIFPTTYGEFEMPPHYFLLATMFGFDYQAILGSPYTNKLKKSFTLDPASLDAALKSLCK